MMISIMIADDHRVVADGLAKLINEDVGFQVIDICLTLQETKRRIAELKPQILLLDVAFPDGDGIDAIPSFRSLSPETQVVMLTMFAEVSVVNRALQAGAKGYLFKNISIDELHLALRAVMKGEAYLCDECRQLLSQSGESAPILTSREREILGLIAEGCTMKEIANRLCLGFETVHSYTKNLRQKLGCNNTASLVRVAVENHLI